MKLTTISVAAAAMFVFAQSAQAREHYRHHRYHAAHFARHYSSPGRGDPRRGEYAAQNMFAENRAKRFAAKITRAKIIQTKIYPAAKRLWRPNRCPYRRASGGVVRLGDAAACVLRSGPALNLAPQLGAFRTGRRNCGRRRRGRRLAAHVGKIVGRDGGEWVVESGNDGHRSAPGRARSPAPSRSAGDDQNNRSATLR